MCRTPLRKHNFGCGKDYKKSDQTDLEKKRYPKFLYAWKVVPKILIHAYVAEMNKVSTQIRKLKDTHHHQITKLKELYANLQGKHPEAIAFQQKYEALHKYEIVQGKSILGQLNESINETFLLHAPNRIGMLAILERGFNKNYAGSGAGTAFGNGVYWCEDICKADQYTWKDDGTSNQDSVDMSDLHQLLYTNNNIQQRPKDIRYVLVNRVVLGDILSHDNSSGSNSATQTEGYKNFQNNKRIDLKNIPNVPEAIQYHSLKVDCHDQHNPNWRFREFITFRNNRALPCYILGYTKDYK